MPASNVEILNVTMEELRASYEDVNSSIRGFEADGELEMDIANEGLLHPLIGAPVYCTIKIKKVYMTGNLDLDNGDDDIDSSVLEEGEYTITLAENETLNLGLLGSFNIKNKNLEFDVDLEGFESYSNLTSKYYTTTGFFIFYCEQSSANPPDIQIDYEVNTVFGSATFNQSFPQEKVENGMSGNLCDAQYDSGTPNN
jgi:hypothetical protein